MQTILSATPVEITVDQSLFDNLTYHVEPEPASPNPAQVVKPTFTQIKAPNPRQQNKISQQ